MKRRTFFAGTLGFLSAGYLGATIFGASEACMPFLNDASYIESARKVGLSLLKNGYQILGALPDPTVNLWQDLPDLAASDFVEGRTVKCDGWIISKSEAEFSVACALVS